MNDHGFSLRAALIARQGCRGQVARVVNAAGRLYRALRRPSVREAGPAMRYELGADGLAYVLPACATLAETPKALKNWRRS